MFSAAADYNVCSQSPWELTVHVPLPNRPHTDHHLNTHTNHLSVMVHTAGRNEEHADEEILQNNSL